MYNILFIYFKYVENVDACYINLSMSRSLFMPSVHKGAYCNDVVGL